MDVFMQYLTYYYWNLEWKQNSSTQYLRKKSFFARFFAQKTVNN